MLDPRREICLYLAWTLALIATLASLFFSEVMQLPPCTLCWYQRICMYPLIPVLTAGILRRDAGVAVYALPLGLSGAAIAAYHNLLYYHFIPESLAPCTQGLSCASRQLEWLGFITIPLMALVGFALISALLWVFHRGNRKAFSS